MMQAVGFTPTDVSLAREEAGAEYGLNKRLLARRNALIDQYYAAWHEKDRRAMAQTVAEMNRFSTKNPQKGLRITDETRVNSIRTRQQRQRQSVEGLYLPLQIRQRIEQIRKEKSKKD